jgi:hypothetical protein
VLCVCNGLNLEASGGFEPPIRVLQTPALPLGYDAGDARESGFYHTESER